MLRRKTSMGQRVKKLPGASRQGLCDGSIMLNDHVIQRIRIPFTFVSARVFRGRGTGRVKEQGNR